MTDSSALPETGSIEQVDAEGAVEVVEGLARGAEVAGRAPERILIALDIDGTVILEDESLSPGVVEAVEHARLAGHEVMIATGRNWASTRGILDALAIEPEYVVCANGAVIMRAVDGEYERFHVETFDPSTVLALLREHLPEAHYVVELPDGERRYTEHLDDWNLQGARQVPFEDLSCDPVSRVVVVAPDASQADFLDLVDRIGLHQVSYAVGWTAWLDIAPEGVDKGTALELVRMWLGADPAHVLVIGDGRNDLGMFAWAVRHGGRAIAMGQADAEVRAAASEVTLPVHEGGVAAILRSL